MSDLASRGAPKRIVYRSEEERPMHASVEAMKQERVPVNVRDFCAHLVIPLNRCRRAQPMGMHFPWQCQEEMHAYERCQYIERLRETKRKLEGEE